MDFSTVNRVTTSTLYSLAGKTVDTVTKFSPLMWALLGKQKDWAGYNGKFPIQYQVTDNGTWFNGLEKFNTALTDDFVNLTFSPTGVEEPIVISGIEASINASMPKVNLVKRAFERSANAMITKVANAFYTLQSGKTFWSVLDVTDDGTNTPSWGGLARSTYTTLKGNLTTGVGNLTLAVMGTMYDSCSNGPDHPDLIIAPKAVWRYYESLITPTRQVVSQLISVKGYDKWTINGVVPATSLHGSQGFNSLDFRGVPVVSDELAPSGTMIFLNTKYVNFYGLKPVLEGYKPFKFVEGSIEDPYDQVPKTIGWGFSGLKVPQDQFGEVGHIILLGNLVSTNPARTGRLEGITGA